MGLFDRFVMGGGGLFGGVLGFGIRVAVKGDGFKRVLIGQVFSGIRA